MYGFGGPVIAATRIFEGSDLRPLRPATTSLTWSSWPISFDTQLAYPGAPGPAEDFGGGWPSQMWPTKLQRYETSGPSGSETYLLDPLKTSELMGAEQSSSFVMRMTARK